MRHRTAEDDAAFVGLGTAIVGLRKGRDLTPDQLAERMGEDDAAGLTRVERGEANADWAFLRAAAKALGVPLVRLLELAEEQAPGEGGDEWRAWTREAERR